MAEVKVGQVWADNDRRMMSRTLDILKVQGGYATVKCRESQKITKIMLKRFKPTSTGYVLVKA